MAAAAFLSLLKLTVVVARSRRKAAPTSLKTKSSSPTRGPEHYLFIYVLLARFRYLGRDTTRTRLAL